MMKSINETVEKIVSSIHIPRMVKVRQNFCRDRVTDIPQTVRRELEKNQLLSRIGRGDRIAITAGSREINNIQTVLKELVRCIKEHGGEPFIVPSMGSHGGATAEGQIGVLSALGINEASVEAPIRASMEVVEVSTTVSGLPVNIDRYAHEADGIIVVARIKQHTSFRAPVESGLAKMIAVGLGKREGAEVSHAAGISEVPRRIMEIAETALEQEKILFGIGLLENAYDETNRIVSLPAERIMAEEPALLDASREHMPQILFDRCDTLIVDEAGKNISGTGMDSNVIRRHYVNTFKIAPLAQRIALLDLTEKSHGNANGMTNADICTERFFNKIDFSETYANPLTNGMMESCKMPVVIKNDRLAIQAAVKGCFNIDLNDARLIRIKNTLHVGEIMISENLLAEARANPRIDIIGEPEFFRFDNQGNMV